MELGKLWWREVFCTYQRQRGEQAWLNSGGVKKCYKAWWEMSNDWQGKLWSRSSAVLCRKSDHEAPAWVSPPITYVLCRDLLYVIKGLFFLRCFLLSSVLENCKLRETRKKLENYCLKPPVCITLHVLRGSVFLGNACQTPWNVVVLPVSQ